MNSYTPVYLLASWYWLVQNTWVFEIPVDLIAFQIKSTLQIKIYYLGYSKRSR